MIKIEKLKIESGSIVVDYSSLLKSFRIATNEEAEPEFYRAAAQVAILGREFLQIDMGGFLSIAFSNSDEPGSRLTLTAATTGGEAKISCPKIAREAIRDRFLVEIPDHPRNLYNDAVSALIKATVDFVNAERKQMALPLELPFEGEAEEEGEEFEERPNVMRFPQPAATASL